MLGSETPPGATSCGYLKQPDKQKLASLGAAVKAVGSGRSESLVERRLALGNPHFE